MDPQSGTSAAVRFARFLRERLGESGLEPLFGDDVTLVPAPRSSILQPGAHWPAWALAHALAHEGLARAVEPCIERHTGVDKAATAEPGRRATAEEHTRTMRLVGAFVTTPKALVVDDIVTRGATLLACATLLRAGAPGLDVSGFAAFRTISDPEGDDWFDPVLGQIRHQRGQTHREP